ncbi:mechanosensitive ion channel family protein [Thalassotalea agarivorans]|uniref:MscS family membrane protein n=1 Tax=Thalassotalea agarivorans TaxID=349064 RepID=A0A1I0GLF3_THASX|nr:mechanosensitive ion channel family protein [Thalassotalea agarivorans]SET71800.1 MscS family membrane protein [Thalassotalea agarivorans]
MFASLLLFLSPEAFAYQEEGVSVKQVLEQQEDAEKEQLEGAENAFDVPSDEFNRGQPRSAMAGFLRAARNNDFALAANYLDLRNLSDATKVYGGEELARKLYVILNRSLWVDLHAISEHPKGNLTEEVPSYRELVGKITTKNGRVNVLLQRIPRKEDRVRIWKISNATVEQIPALYKEFGYDAYGEWLSRHLPSASAFGVELWQWLYYLSITFAYYLAVAIVTFIATLIIKRVNKEVKPYTISFIRGPVTLLATIIIARSILVEENMTFAVRAIFEGATILIFAWCWFFFRAVDLVNEVMKERFISQEKPLAVYLLRPAGTVFKSIIVIVGFLVWLENLGFSATTLLAGLGIGGIAFALAAQKTIENIIGAVTLYTSAPVKIGDYCRFGTQRGVVEEIGLRATRIRTVERTVVHIANSQFVDLQIENYTERERIAYRPRIRVAPDTKHAKLQAFMTDFKALLDAHDMILEKPCRVFLRGFTVQGLDLYVLAYVGTLDWELYLSTTSEINLQALELLNKHDVKVVYTIDMNTAT